jgi:perosamine synthetase
MAKLMERGIETRPVFHPVSSLPPYRAAAGARSFPVAEKIAQHGITLPTWAGLEPGDVSYICDALKAVCRS